MGFLCEWRYQARNKRVEREKVEEVVVARPGPKRRNVSLTTLRRGFLSGAEGPVSIRLVSLCRETRTTVPPTQLWGPPPPNHDASTLNLETSLYFSPRSSATPLPSSTLALYYLFQSNHAFGVLGFVMARELQKASVSSVIVTYVNGI
ncbi:hypothetical protein M0R45_029208 [Rubus argutus]|uniref:Uncharacterized protein n=1 Tax=Rubus argutus TaxID=59490 RepID=A0AAW1W6Y6_RUBAR